MPYLKRKWLDNSSCKPSSCLLHIVRYLLPFYKWTASESPKHACRLLHLSETHVNQQQQDWDGTRPWKHPSIHHGRRVCVLHIIHVSNWKFIGSFTFFERQAHRHMCLQIIQHALNKIRFTHCNLKQANPPSLDQTPGRLYFVVWALLSHHQCTP